MIIFSTKIAAEVWSNSALNVNKFRENSLRIELFKNGIGDLYLQLQLHLLQPVMQILLLQLQLFIHARSMRLCINTHNTEGGPLNKGCFLGEGFLSFCDLQRERSYKLILFVKGFPYFASQKGHFCKSVFQTSTTNVIQQWYFEIQQK